MEDMIQFGLIVNASLSHKTPLILPILANMGVMIHFVLLVNPQVQSPNFEYIFSNPPSSHKVQYGRSNRATTYFLILLIELGFNQSDPCNIFDLQNACCSADQCSI